MRVLALGLVLMSSVAWVRPGWGEVVRSLELSGERRIEIDLATERICENGIFGPSPDGAPNARKETYEIRLVGADGRAEIVIPKVYVWPDGVGLGGIGAPAHVSIYIYDATYDGKILSLALVSRYQAYVEQWERQERGDWKMKQLSHLGSMVFAPETFRFSIDAHGTKDPRRIQIDAETTTWVPISMNETPGSARVEDPGPETTSAQTSSSATAKSAAALDSANLVERAANSTPSPRPGNRMWLYGILGLLVAGMLVAGLLKSYRR